jgi:predicted AAA+ superfamily ATPase
MYERDINTIIESRLRETRKFLQVLFGPRQVGKTTSVRQILSRFSCPVHFVSCDDPALHDSTWLEQQWSNARLMLKENIECILVVDEIQKIPNWSETVKRLWDEDTDKSRNIKVLILGSSALLLHKGLSESMAGRFELIRALHWSFPEMRSAFGFNLEQYIYFGGYPGAASLINDNERWKQYIIDSLIESTISRDILQLERVEKPALLRQLFFLGCTYSGQIMSLVKLSGHLQDAGNTTTLSHYLTLLERSGLLSGIYKYSSELRKRASSPKLNVLNTALMSAQFSIKFDTVRMDASMWGRFVESAVGAHLLNTSKGKSVDVLYWRDRNEEVDFVLRTPDGRLTGIEVKSGRRKEVLSGMASFRQTCPDAAIILVGQDGISLEKFFQMNIEDLVNKPSI